MNDIAGMGGRIGAVGSGRGFYVLSLFVLTIGLARSMGAEDFGAFQQVFMFGALFPVLTLGVPEAMYFFLPRLDEGERPGFLGRAMLLLAGCGTALSLFFTFGAPLLAGFQGNPGIVRNLRFFGAYGGFMVATAFADPIFIVFGRVRYLFLLSVLHGLFFIGITVWRFAAGAPAGSLFAAMTVFGAFKCALAYAFIRRTRPVAGNIDFSGKGRTLLLLSFSLPIALSTTVDIVSAWLDKFVVSVYLGSGPLGVFSVGAMEIPFVSVLLASVWGVVSPVLSSHHHRGDAAGFADLVKKTLHFTAKFIWPLWIYLLVFADRVVPAVFGEGYTPSVVPFRIYLAMMPLRIALYGAVVIALGRPRFVLWSSAGALLLNFVLNIILVTRMGIAGPALATVISSYLHVALLLGMVMAETRAGLADLVPFRGLFEVGVTAGLAALAAFAVPGLGITAGDGETVIVTLVAFTGLYVLLGVKAGFIRPDVLKQIIRESHDRRTDGSQDG